MTQALQAPDTRQAYDDAKVENLGAVFTKRWVVETILDLAGYVETEDLAAARAIEPAAGPGAFVTVMVERLVASCRSHGRAISEAADAIAAFDIDPGSARSCRAAVVKILIRAGVRTEEANRLAQRWVRSADFLLVASAEPKARWVVGNPPYVRLEDVDKDVMAVYRKTWQTMSGRADLYVGFLEAGLALLEEGGKLAVICADRWMRNRYGSALRALVERDFAVDACIIMHDVEAFEDPVAAYPAVLVFRKGDQRPALLCDTNGEFAAEGAARLVSTFRSGPAPIREDPHFRHSWTAGWFKNVGSWPAASPERLALLSTLETGFPTLADAGVHVGVGVATGADQVFITDEVDGIEPDRLLPAISAKEIRTGSIEWKGRSLVNPWSTDGLVALDDFPGMRGYLAKHRTTLERRYVAQRKGAKWWRTIDRVDEDIARAAKLLVPDLKERIHPVLDTGTYYPMHNLYYITAPGWDLRVLGGLLLSDLVNLFVEAYSVRMANGYLRVSAQYLRKIHVPKFEDIADAVREELATAFLTRDVHAASTAARSAYGLVVAS